MKENRLQQQRRLARVAFSFQHLFSSWLFPFDFLPSSTTSHPLSNYCQGKMRSLAFVSLLSAAFSQPSDLTFRRLTIDEGLSQNTINCIHQDRLGFLWLGTQDGLNRYDGYAFKAYHHEPGNINSLGNSYIWAIHEDREGILWIGSFGGGLTRFDPSTEEFSHFRHEKGNPRSLSNNHVFAIAEYPEGTLWLATDDGVSKLDKKTGLITRYLNTPDNIEGLPTNHTATIAVQEPNHLWIGTSTALVKLNISTSVVEYFTTDPGTGAIPLADVQHLVMREGKLRIICAAGLVEYDPATTSGSLVIDRKKVADGTLAFRRVLPDANGYVWIGTNNGVILADEHKSTVTHAVHEDGDEHSLTHNHIFSLYQSRDGIVWIGTRDGLNNVYRIKENFQLIKRRPGRTNTLSHKTVRLVMEDTKGILWIGTVDGLNAYDRKRDRFSVFQHDAKSPRSITSSYILTLHEDRKGNLWVGTRGGGIDKLTFSHNSLTDYAIKKFRGDGSGGLRSNTIYWIYEDRKGTIWAGTSGKGLAKLVSEKQGFKHYERAADGTGPSHSFVYCILEDSFGNMWLGTPTGGLNLLDRESERFIYVRNAPGNPNSISNNIVLSLHEDATHALWVGTSGGLNKLAILLRGNIFRFFQDSVNVSADSLFVAYGRQHGFPNDVIYGILEDDNGRLWLSTNKGLVVFDARRKDPVVRTFDASDGLQNNEFNQNGYFKNSKGEMFFSGVDGVSVFHPDSIRGNSYLPPVVLTDFRLFNESVPILTRNDETGFSLHKAIHQTGELHLSYDHYVLSFDFAALSFVNPGKNQYAYRMEGFDREWTVAGTQRSVTYTNLDPGTYVFRVKASNNDGVWNESGANLTLKIPPPPWLSWYAYLLYGGILISVIAFVIRHRVNAATREMEMKAKIERAKAEEREVVRRQSSADFHDEAGHKLTKISLFTELARGESKNNSSLREYLNKIEEQTKELSSGMRDFI
jgi:ligand-binding sensor domain-containing protein